MYVPGQTTGLSPTEQSPRHYNPQNQKFNTYVGNLWLAIEHDDETISSRLHVPLFTVVRPTTQHIGHEIIGSYHLVFGEEAVAASFAQFTHLK